MKIVDTHSHLQFKAYDSDREEVLKRTHEAGIICINVGTKFETSKNAIDLAETHEGFYAAIGLHPIHIKTDLMKLRVDEDEGGFAPLGETFDEETYLELGKSKRVVAVGEVGLDYYYKPKGAAKKEQFKENQKVVFKQQIDLANKLDLPLIIHCRMAHADCIEILKEKDMHRGVVHCFTGTWDEAKQYLDLGFHIGVNGIIFKFNMDEVIKNTSIEKILLETDCPYLTPTEAPQERNEPMFVTYTIGKIAELKGLSIEEVEEKTTANAKALFKI
jgi:TatD DNase family protein